ncbi:MAG: methyltransferase domain-containing protein [Sedimentisphaerales bacterium]|nr:methyltransferase domain-containing protein [Sedimentisphaerales bacterium]
MSELKDTNARYVAAQVLNRFKPERNYAAEILNKLLDRTQQRQRATDLVFGTIRNRFAIDAAINKFAGCPIPRIQKKLLNIIRVACYELVYSPTTADYSIVNDAVENTKGIAGTRQAGFINALLRRIIKHISGRQISLSQANSRRTLPQSIETGCEFDADFLPDCENETAEYLSTVFSLPQWLVNDWLTEFGAESAREICQAQNRRPGIYIRPNPLKITTEQLMQLFEKDHIESEKVPDVAVMRIKSPKTVTQLPGFDEGFFIVQDLTASRTVGLLSPQPDWTILDLCAAPGVKTTQLAEVTSDSARIIATDIDAERLKKVEENINRLGIKSVEIVSYNRLPDIAFDCILLDVPCSNTGVLAKRIEARYRIRPETIAELAKTQTELLEKAVELLKPQGKICYSTCSIQRQENNDVVKNFLRQHPEYELEKERLILPSAEGFDCDGGYAAIIQRR